MSQKLYLVRWLHGFYFYFKALNGGFPRCPASPRLVRAFNDPAAAAAFCQKLQSGALPPPRDANPFQVFDDYYPHEDAVFNGLHDLSSMPEPIFCDWLRETGLEPPAEAESGKVRDWASWWDQHAPRMTDLQRAKVWQALDRLRFYEIVETELED